MKECKKMYSQGKSARRSSVLLKRQKRYIAQNLKANYFSTGCLSTEDICHDTFQSDTSANDTALGEVEPKQF